MVRRTKEFSNEQLQLLFNQLKLRSYVGMRVYTFMLLLLETGIRVSELKGVCVQDILNSILGILRVTKSGSCLFSQR